jgi:predicted phage terminase large subunit-like protein
MAVAPVNSPAPAVSPVEIRPQDGSQEAFLASRADIVFYGGEAGSGKTGGLVLEALRNYDVPGFGAIIFRRTSPQLEGPGSLWELMSDWYPLLDARLTQNPFKAVFPSGASVRLDHLQYDTDKLKHQGKGYVLIGFDELPHFLETQFWYLYSRSRSTTGVRAYIRATMNPTADSWVKKLIAWYLDERGEFIRPERSGVLRYFYRVDDELDWGDSEEELRARHPERRDRPTSFTFILGLLSDNKILLAKDPGYPARLMALPRVERERLLGSGRGGNWLIRPAAGLYFQRSWFRVIPAAPTDVVAIVRAWDKAATQVTVERPDPDWTRGVKMAATRSGRFVVLHIESLRGSPHQVDRAMANIAAQDGKAVKICIWQDPGAAGVVDVAHTKSILVGYWVESVIAREDKVSYAGPFSTQVEAGNVDVLAGAWNEAFFAELEGFPDGAHDDMVDACSRAFLALHKPGVLAYQSAMDALRVELLS